MRLTLFSANRMPALTSSIRQAAAGVTPLDIWAVVLPALSFLQFHLGGQLIFSELLALAILPWLLRSRERLLVPRWLIGLGGAWLVFQVVTDVVVHTAFIDWSRGWAAIVFTLIDLAVIICLVSTPRRARLFLLGSAAGGFLGYIVVPDPNAATDAWKWAFAGPIGSLLVVALSGARGARQPWLVVGALAIFGLVNAFLGYRSMSGVALITAAYLLLAFFVAARLRLRAFTVKVAALGLASYGAAAIVVFLGLSAAAQAGVFGQAAAAKFDAQTTVIVTPSPPVDSGRVA